MSTQNSMHTHTPVGFPSLLHFPCERSGYGALHVSPSGALIHHHCGQEAQLVCVWVWKEVYLCGGGGVRVGEKVSVFVRKSMCGCVSERGKFLCV
jgi:hypothetical protein